MHSATDSIELLEFDVTQQARMLWDWLNAERDLNFDDYGPQDFQGFCSALVARMAAGEIIVTAHLDGEPIGSIGYRPISPRGGVFHGICFDPEVRGTGAPQAAVRAVLNRLRAQGVRKVSASFFADNTRVYKFLRGLGARDEGYLVAQTMRAGVPIDMRLVAIHLGEEGS